jgi:hypothetical protein
VGENVGDSVVGDAVGMGLLVAVFFLYMSRNGGNVTSAGNGEGGLVTGKGVGSGEGDVGVDVRITGAAVRIKGAGVGGFVPSTPMFVGGNSIAAGEVSVIGGVCWIAAGFEVGE